MNGTVVPTIFIHTYPVSARRELRVVSPAYQTPAVRSSTVGIYTIPLGTLLGDSAWKLKAALVVDIRRDDLRYVAIHHSVDEYGIGATPAEAESDLLTSLVDYRASLERRQDTLASQGAETLRLLEMIMEPR